MRTELYLKTLGIESKTEPSIPSASDKRKAISVLIDQISELNKTNDLEVSTHMICEIIYSSVSLSHVYGIPDKIIIALNEVHKCKVREIENLYMGEFKPNLGFILKRNTKLLKDEKDGDSNLESLVLQSSCELNKYWEDRIERTVYKKLSFFDKMLSKLVDALSSRLRKRVVIVNRTDAYCRKIADITVYGKKTTIIDF